MNHRPSLSFAPHDLLVRVRCAVKVFIVTMLTAYVASTLHHEQLL
jgi:hypothetical protein